MSKMKLLLVDDEEEYVRTMAARLSMRNVSSQVALTGEDALAAVAADAPHVMVLDLRMPGIDGMAVLERVKREHPHVQVIILTGHGSEDEKRKALQLGAFDYLEKPADTGQLLGVIREAWKRALRLLKESEAEFSRSMVAAAMAEAGDADSALEHLARTRETGSPAPVLEPEPALKVLFVDDEEDFVRTLAQRMEMRDMGGDVALSGQEALAALEREPPDVIVLDLKMPGLGGMEVLRRVKKLDPAIEIIIMTGHGSVQDEEEAKRLGAFEYLRKPVEIEVLMDAVRQAGQQRRASPGSRGGEAVGD